MAEARSPGFVVHLSYQSRAYSKISLQSIDSYYQEQSSLIIRLPVRCMPLLQRYISNYICAAMVRSTDRPSPVADPGLFVHNPLFPPLKFCLHSRDQYWTLSNLNSSGRGASSTYLYIVYRRLLLLCRSFYYGFVALRPLLFQSTAECNGVSFWKK